MRKSICLAFIFQGLILCRCYAQEDTIKVDASVSMVSEKDLIASEIKKGDTTLAFKVAESVVINNSERQNFIVVNKGAQVLAVIESSLLPYKLKPVRNQKPWDENADFFTPRKSELKIGGEIVVRFISVQAVDNTYIPLHDCSMLQTGGEAGSEKNLKAMAVIPAGSRKTCLTKYPDAVLILQKQN